MKMKMKIFHTSITLRSSVIGVGIEMVFPILSPMVKRVVVIKEATPELRKRIGNSCDITGLEKVLGIDFTAVEDILVKYKNKTK